MVLMAMSAIPRGGRVVVDADDQSLQVRAIGERARIPEKCQIVMQGEFDADELDARMVQVYYAMRLADEAACRLTANMDGDDVVFSASPSISSSFKAMSA